MRKATYGALALAVSSGVVIGAAITGLHAQNSQNKAKAYLVAEVEITGDRETYMRDYAAHVQATLDPFGGHFLVRGGRSAVTEGDPPKGRVAIVVFDSFEKAQAFRNSPEYLKILPVRERLAKSRQYIVEGIAE
jgi:uncharacterized protein (DUF1330 family)